MTSEAKHQQVIVAGDVTVDWNIARIKLNEEGTSRWNNENETRISVQAGGAALLADLMQQMAGKLDGVEVLRGCRPQMSEVNPADVNWNHVYAVWENQGKAGSSAPWRAVRFLGVDHAVTLPEFCATEDVENPAVVLLDDADLGFRNAPQAWPQAIRQPVEGALRPWIILKMARPVAQGMLWEQLMRHFADRVIALVSVDDLRSEEVHISRELSWERTAQDLAQELVNNPQANLLSRCAHVVVLFRMAGAVLMSHHSSGKEEAAPRCTLFYDPKVIEGMWEQRHPGFMMGYGTCLAASLARQVLLRPEFPDLSRAIHAGLEANRTLHLSGYRSSLQGGKLGLQFPFEEINRVLAEPGLREFSQAQVRYPARTGQPGTGEFWTILSDRYHNSRELEKVAEAIVIDGLDKALKGVPMGIFSGLTTVDRREIESLRSIRALVGEYCQQAGQKKPLSIAVFGAPGSGKSFAIEQIARSLSGQIEKMPEFNLSQFQSEDDLIAAFHQIRDQALAGKIPLVFWDEFDSGNLKWLRSFLAPMQDGKFQGGHPLGRCIFVFAGGTSERMEDFDRHDADFRMAKGPDFVSRLRGYVNVLGANRLKSTNDRYYIIRRAILLRSVLERNAARIIENGHLNMDRGVLRAFLHVSEYRHGARSMEAVVTSSMLAGKNRFERSCLPSEGQLNLHVDGAAFMALALQMDFERDLTERFAASQHTSYCRELQEQKFHWGLLDDPARKTSPLLVDYEFLPEEFQQQNRDNARATVDALRKLGCAVIADHGEPDFVFTIAEVEALAEQEHIRYVKDKLSRGWRYGETKRSAQKTNPSLRLWREYTAEELAAGFTPREQELLGLGVLSEEEKEKTRGLVNSIPLTLKEAGYAIKRIPRRMVKIGVTGHRFLVEEARIVAGVYAGLQAIEQEFPGEPLVVLSALAQGADCLVAQRILGRGQSELIAVMPIPKADYLETFTTAKARREFEDLLQMAKEVVELPAEVARDAAYAAAGRFIVENCDVLIAMWDGLAAQGEGGTAEVVSLARQRGLPIVWIHAGNRIPGTHKASSLGEEQGKVTFEGFSIQMGQA